MILRILHIVIALLIGTTAFSQSLTPSVFSSLSFSAVAGKYRLSASVGEVVVPLFKNGKSLTQGFQQPLRVVPKKEKLDNTAYEMPIAFPNPATERLNVVLPTALSRVRVEIYGVTGNLVKQFQKINEENKPIKLDINDLKSGSYFLRIIDLDELSKPVFLKIIKI